MPQVINSGGNKPTGKQPSANRPPLSDEELKEKNKLRVLVGVCAVLLLIAFFMFRTFILQPSPPAPTRVGPPPGWPDIFPYNTKEWREKTKDGTRNVSLMSGVPGQPSNLPASATAMPGSAAPASGGK